MSIVDYLERRGYEFRKANHVAHKSICPIHGEKDPSFWVYEADDHYHCFGCGANGDLPGLIRALEFADEPTSKELWRRVYERAKMYGHDKQSYVPPPARPRHDPTPEESLAMTIMFRHYQRVLETSTVAQEYLKSRGLQIGSLPLGYCSGNAKDYMNLAALLKKELGTKWREICVNTGLLYENGSERLSYRIVIAEIRDNKVIYLQGRAIFLDAFKRYMNPGDLRKPIFGLETLKWDGEYCILVEGVFDALPLHLGHIPAVSLLGTKFAENLPSFIQAVGHKRVAVMTDADAPGDQAGDQLMAILKDANIPATRVSPYPQNDVGELVQKIGIHDFINRMNRAMNCSNDLTSCTSLGNVKAPEEVIV